MCRFIAYQPLCPCEAVECAQMRQGSVVYGGKRLHYRGEVLIRSWACEYQELRRCPPNRSCPLTAQCSRPGVEHDPAGYLRDERVCHSCKGCADKRSESS